MEVVQFLVQQYPESLGVINRGKWTPLHFACDGERRPIQVDKMVFLLESYPKAASERSSKEKTPLSVLLYNWDDDGYEIPVEAVRLLLKAAPDAA